MEAVTEYLRDASPLAFFSINALISTVAVIPGGASGICIAAGALYGLLAGTLLYVLSSVTGAVLCFALARSAARPLVQRALRRYEKRLRAIDSAVVKEGIKIVILLRLAPVTPFVACNFLLGLTAVDVVSYTLGTLIGLGPSSFVYVYLGAVGAQATSASGSSTADLAVQTVGLFATLIVTYMVVKIAQSALDAAVDVE
eukprot:GGOE01018116.1.p1 GENE.GGOE01018116.1~~GGOE01018116.1.p1  ORF type:complete len:199 (+),score=67.28 GGOE01018116.1:40-636(+)